MMKEIRARGPMPANILAPWAFSYYKSRDKSFQYIDYSNFFQVVSLAMKK